MEPNTKHSVCTISVSVTYCCKNLHYTSWLRYCYSVYTAYWCFAAFGQWRLCMHKKLQPKAGSLGGSAVSSSNMQALGRSISDNAGNLGPSAKFFGRGPSPFVTIVPVSCMEQEDPHAFSPSPPDILTLLSQKQGAPIKTGNFGTLKYRGCILPSTGLYCLMLHGADQSWKLDHFTDPIQSNPIHGWIQSMSNSGADSQNRWKDKPKRRGEMFWPEFATDFRRTRATARRGCRNRDFRSRDHVRDHVPVSRSAPAQSIPWQQRQHRIIVIFSIDTIYTVQAIYEQSQLADWDIWRTLAR